MAKRQRDESAEAASSAAPLSASVDSAAAGVAARLSRSQLKNRSKRLRAKRPCHRCGRAGHKRSECGLHSTAGTAAHCDDGSDASELQCLGCRRFGHRLSDCTHLTPPQRPTLTAADALLQHNDSSSAGNEAAAEEPAAAAAPTGPRPGRICYHCGSAAHTAGHCLDGPSAAIGGGDSGGQFAFAVCFVCQSVGHLARHCPRSDRGMFVRGGSCHTCGSKQHKAKHCTASPATPPQQQQQAAEGTEGKGEEAATSPQRLSMQQLGLSQLVKPSSSSKTVSQQRRRSVARARHDTAPWGERDSTGAG